MVLFTKSDFGPSTRHITRYLNLLDSVPVRKKVKGTYLENHHVYPSCIFGKNHILVVLTIREHIIAHELLWRHYKEIKSPYQYKLGIVMNRMSGGKKNQYDTNGIKISSRLKAIARQAMHESSTGERNPFYGKKHPKEIMDIIIEKGKGRKHSEEIKKQIGISSSLNWKNPEYRDKVISSMKGRPVSEYSREVTRRIHTGKIISEETRAKISVGNKGKLLGVPKSDETRAKMSASGKGRKMSEDLIERINRNPEKIRKTAEKHRGMKRSEETKAKISEKAKGRVSYNKGLVNYYHPETLEKIKQHKDLPSPEGF